MTTTETITIVTGLVLLYAGIKGFQLVSYLKAAMADPSTNPGQYYVNSLVKPGEQGKIRNKGTAATTGGSVQSV